VSNILFANANLVLDGFAELQPSFNVLVKDNYIHSVSPIPINCQNATVIDVGGRTVMPGLIDAHAHITGLSLSPKNVSYPASNIAMAAANYLTRSLMDGFTTIREAGGADYSIAQLVAQGEIASPRLFYSGRALTQTGGGADFRTPYEHTDPCGHISPFSVMSVIADGVDEVRKAAREEQPK
jgi:imidazolonepropionase-like amidohydrolase